MCKGKEDTLHQKQIKEERHMNNNRTEYWKDIKGFEGYY